MNKLLTMITIVLSLTLLAQASLNLPRVIMYGDEDYHPLEQRKIQMVSSLAVSDSGRIWVNWYAGPTPGEDENNYIVLATSDDDGESWQEVLIIDPGDERTIRAFDPEIWLAPDGKLWVFWAQAVSHGIDAYTWAMTTDNPDDANPQWSQPRVIAPGVMMCKPTVLSDGTWLFPISDWEGRRLRTPDAPTAQAWVSVNHGRTIYKIGSCLVPVDVRSYDEHMFVERKDGSLWLLARTRYGIGESISTDGGKTWPDLTPSDIAHPSARFFISRLNSGNLLLVKHGPIDEQTGRSHLMAFISDDDGQTWQGGFLLDERTGISYPDGQQTEDGTIYITYDRSRRGAKAIYMATFTEADALAGEAVSDKVRLRVTVSRGVIPEADRNEDGAALLTEPAGRLNVQGSSIQKLEAGAVLFSDRGYRSMEMPDALEDVSYLQVPMNGTKTATALREGMVYFLTPQPHRNTDSQTKRLEEQGFEKVALPEIPLFDHRAPNFVTLYQKNVQAGEVVEFGKWAVPLFF